MSGILSYGMERVGDAANYGVRETDALTQQPAYIAENIVHSLGTYGIVHGGIHLFYAVLAFFAFSELLGADVLTVMQWIICTSVLLGAHFIAGGVLIPRMYSDRKKTRRGGPTLFSHHIPFFWHLGTGLITKVVLMLFFVLFEYQHDVAAFNDARFSEDPVVPTGKVWMYLQWVSVMVIFVVFFFIDTVHVANVVDVIKNPRINYHGLMDE